ncbi:MAG: fibronectin type III domain-containing protein, partial [Thermoplasmata archaeon]|nr:fibronectin type III domain-containing protein [Thermoplasmata archaeon]
EIITGQTFELRPLSVPSAPTGLLATAGNTTLQVGWSPVASTGAGVNYTVSIATALTGPWGNNHTLAGTAYTYSGLTDGTKYFVTVVASNVVGQGPAASPVNATPLGIPYPPISVTAVGASNTTLNVSWAAPTSTGGAPVTNYTLKWSLATSSIWTSVSEGTSLATTITGLKPVTNYTVFVVAWNKVGSSNASAKVTAETKATHVVHPPASSGSSSSNNLLLYVILGVIIAAVLAAVALMMMRRKKPATAGIAPYPGPSGPVPPAPSSPPQPPAGSGASPWTEDSGPSPPPGAQ